jgi:hypothetical protein
MSKIFCGITLLAVPTIIYGGYFLLTLLLKIGNEEFTEFQQNMFRAGHAHAGVLVLLSLVVQLLIDHSSLSSMTNLFLRVAFPLSAILISAGFFLAAIGDHQETPTDLIVLLYIGVVFLLAAAVMLGIGLLKKGHSPLD